MRRLVAAAALSLLQPQDMIAGDARPFTVRDSIGMTRIDSGVWWLDNPGASAAYPFITCPDGSQTLVVVRRGNLETNDTEYRLLSYATSEVQRFVNLSSARSSEVPYPQPRVLATFATDDWRYGIDSVRWTLNGRGVLFIGRGKERSRPRERRGQVYRVDVTSRSLRQLTHHPEDIGAFALSLDGQTLVYSALVPAEDWRERNSRGYAFTSHLIRDTAVTDPVNASPRYWEYHILDLRTNRLMRASTPRTVLPRDVWLSPSGRRAIAIVTVGRTPPSWREYSFVKQIVAERSRGRDSVDHGMADPTLLEDTADEAFDAWHSTVVYQFYLIDTLTGTSTPLVDAPAYFAADSPQAIWSIDETRVLLAPTFLPLDTPDVEERDRRTGFQIVADIDLSTGRVSRVTDLRPAVENNFLVGLEGLERLRDGSVVVSQRVFKDSASVPTRSRRRFVRSNERWVEDRRLAKRAIHRFNETVLEYSVVEDLNTPPEIAARDRVSGRQRVITDLNPQFRTLAFGRVESIEWRDRLGRNHLGGLVRPPDYVAGQRYPVVIQTYGFAPDKFLVDGPPLASKAAFAAQALANKGMLVLQMPESFRAAPDVSGGYKDTGEIPLFIALLESAIDTLDAKGLIDRERVGLIGFSRSGMQVAGAITFSEHPIAAATMADSISDTPLAYASMLGFPNFGMAEMEHPSWMGAPLWGDGIKTWLERSTLFHLERIQTPVRLETYASGVDSRWDMYAILKRFRRPIELIHIPDGTHVLVTPQAVYASQHGNVDWFAFWLMDEEDRDPAKADQYVRWRKLRVQHEAHIGRRPFLHESGERSERVREVP